MVIFLINPEPPQYCPRKTKGVRERFSRSMLTDSLVSKCPFPALSGRYNERRINLFSVHSTFWLVVLVNVLPDMLFRGLFITSNMKIYLETPTGIWNASAHMTFCTAKCKIFIKPPPDTQRTERQGERGIWVAMGCYLLQVTPPPPPPPPPSPKLCVCRTTCGHVIRIRGLKESPPPSPPPRIIDRFLQPRQKSRMASILETVSMIAEFGQQQWSHTNFRLSERTLRIRDRI
jgi:hypothetical protein